MAFLITAAFSASFLLLSLVYPDIWLWHTRRLVIVHETMAPLESTFILVSHFFHGGIQLWDRFDQMNNAYFVLSNGVYGILNIITAAVFVVLLPFFSHPGEALYHVHLFVYYGLALSLRTIGGYLLLRKFTTDRGVIFVSLLYLNLIMTGYMMTPGIVTQAVFSFLPLLLYFILSFFEEWRLRPFLLSLAVMVLCFACSPLFTLGYFYQAVHFFLLACLISFLFQRGWRKLKGRPSAGQGALSNAAIFAACVLVVLPYLFWAKSLFRDFYVAGSGIGDTQGRFNNIFNLAGYFNIQGKAFSNPMEFLGTSLDYTHNVWGSSWAFIGAGCLGFSLVGLVLSKDKRKHIFWITILCLILVNTACFPENFSALSIWVRNGHHFKDLPLYFWVTVSSVTHGINVLTNPFSFLVRSFQMSALLVPMFFLPLMALGLEACRQLWRREEMDIYPKRAWALAALFAFIFVWSSAGGTQALQVFNSSSVGALKPYVMTVSGALFLFILMIKIFPAQKMQAGWMILGVVFLMDLTAGMVNASVYPRYPWDQAVPTRLSPAFTSKAVMPDYQNPLLLSWKEFMNTTSPMIGPVIYSWQCMYGAFYQFDNIGRFFHPWSIYEPRPKMYRNLYPDTRIQVYLERNPRSIFFADYAFDLRYLSLTDIMQANLDRRVVIVDPKEYNKAFLKKAELVYVNGPAPENFYHLRLDAAKAKKEGSSTGIDYIFDLPKDFPYYLSTTVFTGDYTSWRLTAGSRTLSPMQGKLTTPWTYDVQNFHHRKLTVRGPKDETLPQAMELTVKLPEGIRQVWKNTYDDLGLTYEAPRSGWMVFQYPYDARWELNIDGRRVPVSQVNGYFIGAPITPGQHQVLLRYWPHTILRALILVSMVLSVYLFWKVILDGLKRQSL
jgi:hypothetical protein